MSEDMSIDLESDTLTETTLAWYLHLFISLTQTFNTMKKIFYFLALAAVLALITGCRRGFSMLYVLGNQTGKQLIIYPPYHLQGEDSTILAPGEYFKIGSVVMAEGYGVKPDCFYYQKPFYISMDGVKYQIDRNEPDNCLWVWNYRYATQEETDALLKAPDSGVEVYDLTEDYIKRQIVVEE